MDNIIIIRASDPDGRIFQSIKETLKSSPVEGIDMIDQKETERSLFTGRISHGYKLLPAQPAADARILPHL